MIVSFRISVRFWIIMKGNAMKNLWMVSLLLILMNCSVGLSQDFKRFEAHVSGGLTVSGDIPLDTAEDIHYESIQVSSSHNVGAAFAININRLDAVELSWQRQFTEGRLPSELAPPLSSGNPAVFNLNIDQYHMNFIHHYELSIPRTRPYVMAGLGATTYYANGNGISDAMRR